MLTYVRVLVPAQMLMNARREMSASLADVTGITSCTRKLVVQKYNFKNIIWNFVLQICIAPSLGEVNETKCSLNFGLRAMRITNVARLNVEVNTNMWGASHSSKNSALNSWTFPMSNEAAFRSLPEKKTTSWCKPKVSYRKFPFRLIFWPECSVEWFPLWKFNNSRIFCKFSQDISVPIAP